MFENSDGRLKLLSKFHRLQDFIKDIPKDRMTDIYNQLPNLKEDLDDISQTLEKDRLTIMVAGIDYSIL
jgi:propanediol dehydratase small subunit